MTVSSTLVNIIGGVTKKLSGKTVVISSSRTEDTFSQPGAVTDSNGQASGTIKSTKAGQATVTCKDETDGVFLSTTPSLTFNPGPASSLALQASSEAAAGSLFSLKAILSDRYGNAASSLHSLSFSSTDSRAVLPNAYQLTGGDGGSHTFTDIVLKTAGLKTVTVKDEDINISSTASINVIPASFSNETSSFTSTKSKLIVNKDKASLKATALDGYGNSLSDKEISISFNSSYGDLKVKIGKTGASGIGEFEFTPKKEGKVVFSAYNETDETAIGTPVTIEVLSDTIINNIAADISAGISSATNTITQGKEAAMSAAKAVSLLVEALQESGISRNSSEGGKEHSSGTASLGLIPIIANIVGSAPAAIHVVNYGISLSLEALGVKKDVEAGAGSMIQPQGRSGYGSCPPLRPAINETC